MCHSHFTVRKFSGVLHTLLHKTMNFNGHEIMSNAYKKCLQTSNKRLKLSKYFPMVFFSYKKRIPQRKTKLGGKTNLRVMYTFHMVNQIHVEY